MTAALSAAGHQGRVQAWQSKQGGSQAGDGEPRVAVGAASLCIACAAGKQGGGLSGAPCAQYKTQLRNLREKVEEDIEVVKRREVRHPRHQEC